MNTAINKAIEDYIDEKTEEGIKNYPIRVIIEGESIDIEESRVSHEGGEIELKLTEESLVYFFQKNPALMDEVLRKMGFRRVRI